METNDKIACHVLLSTYSTIPSGKLYSYFTFCVLSWMFSMNHFDVREHRVKEFLYIFLQASV